MKKIVLAAVVAVASTLIAAAPAQAQRSYGGNCRNGNECNRQGERSDPNYGNRGAWYGSSVDGAYSDDLVLAVLLAETQTRAGKVITVRNPAIKRQFCRYGDWSGYVPMDQGCPGAPTSARQITPAASAPQSASGTSGLSDMPASATVVNTFKGGVTYSWTDDRYTHFVTKYDGGQINRIDQPRQ